MYYYERLSQKDKKVYEVLRNGLERHYRSIICQDSDDLQSVLKALFLDNPQFYFVNDHSFTSCKHKASYCEVIFHSLYSDSQIEQTDKRLKQIVDGFRGLSPINAVKKVHEYLIRGVKYDYAELEDKDYVLDENHNIVGALLRGNAVCSGYSEAFSYIMNSLGVECTIIVGKVTGESRMGGLHAWNAVKLNGKWYHVDVTFDDGASSPEKGYISYEYYLVSDAVMRKDRTWSNGPKCVSDDMDYYVTNRLVVQTTTDLRNVIRTACYKKENAVFKCVRLSHETVLNAIAQSLQDVGYVGNYELYSNDKFGTYGCILHYGKP